MLESFVQWLLDRFRDLGYPGIVVLMAMESSILPVPSELVMPPAGYLAAKGEMSFVLAVACGVLGSIIGALANYYGAHWIGGPFLRRYGKYVFLSEAALARSERFFAQHGEFSTFVGRLFPVVRHLISIPAGLHRMPLPKFIGYTALGAFVWCTILTAIGYALGRNEAVLQNEEVQRYATWAILALIPIVAIAALIYIRWRRRKSTTPVQ
jgi:membrane protein DedA with SNARE-associated domain